MFAHVIARIRSNNFVEDYGCTMCEDVYPKIVADKLERAWDKPKRLYRDALAIMGDGYARFVEPLVSRLESFQDHAPRVAELREKIRRQLSVAPPPSANAKWN
jgi:hypothetical protein